MDLLLDAVVIGVLLGCFYAAVSLGLSVSFGLLDVPHVAHPAFLVLASYAVFFLNDQYGVDPLLAGVRSKMGGDYQTSDKLAGHLSAEWAEKLGLRAGIPIPVGAFDAHWDAIGANIREGDVVNVVGTSTCIIAIAREAELVPGVCGVVPGSVTGVMVGLASTGATSTVGAN